MGIQKGRSHAIDVLCFLSIDTSMFLNPASNKECDRKKYETGLICPPVE
jgi:hypothetical protein